MKKMFSMSGIRTSNRLSDIVDVTHRSARAGSDLLIFEIGSMADFMPLETAEEIRKLFVINSTPVRQLTSYRHLDAWTSVDALPKTLQQIKTVYKDVFDNR